MAHFEADTPTTPARNVVPLAGSRAGGLMPGERRETVAEQSVPTHVADTMAYQVATDVRALRAFVSAGALARGLPAERVELLTLAVSELATNTLQHTTGGGWVRLWAEPASCSATSSTRGRRGSSAGNAVRRLGTRPGAGDRGADL